MTTSAELHGERKPKRRTAGRRQLHSFDVSCLGAVDSLSQLLMSRTVCKGFQLTIDTPYMGVPDAAYLQARLTPCSCLRCYFRSWPQAPATAPHCERD